MTRTGCGQHLCRPQMTNWSTSTGRSYLTMLQPRAATGDHVGTTSAWLDVVDVCLFFLLSLCAHTCLSLVHLVLCIDMGSDCPRGTLHCLCRNTLNSFRPQIFCLFFTASGTKWSVCITDSGSGAPSRRWAVGRSLRFLRNRRCVRSDLLEGGASSADLQSVAVQPML